MKPEEGSDTRKKSPVFTVRGQRRFVFHIFVLGVLVIVGLFCLRPENQMLLRRLMQSTGSTSMELADVSRAKPIPGLDASVFDTIEDRTIVRSEEAAAFRAVIQLFQTLSDKELQEYCIGRVLFAQYMKQPEIYRGKLLTLHGVARRATEERGYSEAGLEKIYSIWISPEDCPTEPVVVYCLELPEHFPLGEDIAERVTFTAVFFKIWPYASQSGVRTTGLFYAKKPEWSGIPSDTFQQKPYSVSFWIALVGGFSLAVLMLFLIRFRIKSAEEPLETLPETVEIPTNLEVQDAVDLFDVSSAQGQEACSTAPMKQPDKR